MYAPTRNRRRFRRTLFETEPGIRRTLLETQRTIGETDAQWLTGGARWPGSRQRPGAAVSYAIICFSRVETL
jgi:hypothetical protein